MWVIALTGIGIGAFTGVGGPGLFDRLDTGWTWGEGESTEADALLSQGDAEASTLLVHGVDTASAELAEITAELSAGLTALEGVSVVDALAVPRMPDGSVPPQAAALFSANGDGFLVVATVESGDGGAPEDTVGSVDALLVDAAAQIRALEPGATAEVSSDALLSESIMTVSEHDLLRGEAVALPIALLVMLAVFGGFLAAGLPLIGAIASIIGGLGAIFGFAHLMDVSTVVMNVVTAIGLGLSIDYGLLIVSRFREESRALNAGDAPARTGRHSARAQRIAGIARAADTAGRTVLYSGIVFAIASLGLLLFDLQMVRAIGIGALSVTLIAILSALTLLPALLSLMGGAILKPGLLTRVPGLGRLLTRFGDVAPEEGVFSRLTRRVQRHPAIVTLACAAVLLLLGAPALQMRLTNTAMDSLPEASTQHSFVTTLSSEFPHVADARVELVTRSEADARAWAEEVRGVDSVVSVAEPVEVEEVWASQVEVEHGAGDAVVADIRGSPPPFDHWVTGADARTVDLAATLAEGVPWAILVVALGTVVLLFLMTGSLIVPLKALTASVLSLGASIGVLVWGFQEGNFSGLMGFDPDDVLGVDVIVLLLTLVFGFGLAMDYEMFILSRITELVDRGVESTEAIALGIQRSGRIITSAALIIIVVFAGFATGDLMLIKQLGTALAVAVLLDATIVRCLLVPALMTWQRRIMWWAPRWMKRIHARFGLRD